MRLGRLVDVVLAVISGGLHRLLCGRRLLGSGYIDRFVADAWVFNNVTRFVLAYSSDLFVFFILLFLG